MFEDYFSKRLVQLRLQKGVSGREMSLAIGQGPAYINNIENQRRMPSMTGFFYICEYLGITPGEFFNEELETPKEVRQFLEYFQHLSPEQRSNILFLMGEILKK